MSYILDALKKADAERERAAVPGLHAHPQDGLSSRDERSSVPWVAVAIGAIVVLGGALAWVLWADRGVRTPPLVAAAPPAPQPTAAIVAAPPPIAAPAPSTAPAATPAPPPAAAEPAPTPTVVISPPPPPPTPAPAPVPVAAPAAPSPKATEPRLPTQAELPADVRAGLPPLAISGAVYSPTPSARMVFINGAVLREGDAVVDGVVLERIGASASVLSVRGTKFEVRH